MSTSFFSQIELAPRDPILGLTEAYNADNRDTKVNLGVGVYYDDNGKIPLLVAVRQAEQQLFEKALPRGYQPIDGNQAYNSAVQKLLFGTDSALIKEGRAVTAQALGGTGALKIGADFLKKFFPGISVYIPDPSWENHRALFEAAGFDVKNYSYYDPATRGVDFNAMTASLSALPQGSVVVLHACCHNPTGADLDKSQWQQVVDICRQAGLLPFIDFAYQGFAEGIEADAVAVRLFAQSGLQFFVSSSFSKSFSLYGERIGAITIVTAGKDESARVLSQIKKTIRTNYSNPPVHGGAIVATVLNSVELKQMWESELTSMRERIQKMRNDLVEQIKQAGASQDFSFVMKQRGMFSYTGLTQAQVESLKQDFGIYAVSTGRICLAALNSKNITSVAKAITSVLKK